MQIGTSDYRSCRWFLNRHIREQFLFGKKKINGGSEWESWVETAQRGGEEDGWGKLARSRAGAPCNLFSRR